MHLLRSNPDYQVHLANGMNKAQLLKELAPFHGLIVRSATQVTKDVIDAGENLKVIGRAGSGLDNIDMDYATARGIAVFNTPGSNAQAVAEFTISMIFALARQLFPAVLSMKNEQWEKSSLTGREIRGKTLGLIGFGQIGQKVGRMAAALSMEVLVYKTRPVLKSPGYEFELVSLETILSKSDYLSLHLPKNEQTTRLLNFRRLKMMKPGAFLINCARGGIVNERDLVKALDKQIIAGAALDVFEKEPPDDYTLIRHKRVIATPHIAGSTSESQERVGIDIVKMMMTHLEANYLFL